MKRPAFWDTPGLTWQSFFLTPASLIYGIGRILHVSFLKAGRTPVPLICVGNVTLGGAGKTPVVLDLGSRLKRAGRAVHFLSRGYGGSLPGPDGIYCTQGRRAAARGGRALGGAARRALGEPPPGGRARAAAGARTSRRPLASPGRPSAARRPSAAPSARRNTGLVSVEAALS